MAKLDEVITDHTLMHLLQAFLIESVRQVHEKLPPGTEVLTTGRTIVRGRLEGQEFVVQLKMHQFDDDMWPHIDSIVRLAPDSPDERIDMLHVFPDSTPEGHAQQTIDRLVQLVRGEEEPGEQGYTP